MGTTKMSNTKDLITYDEKTILECFSSDDGLNDVVGKLTELVGGFEHDMSTGASRAKTASLSSKVASFKVKMDGLGKDLVSDWKNKSKAVDKNRKSMRDALDELKEEARKPLTDWEDEQKRIEADEAAKVADEALLKEIESDHEISILMDREFDRIKEDQAKKEGR